VVAATPSTPITCDLRNSIEFNQCRNLVRDQGVNAKERRLRRHVSDKLILIEPADPIVSVGLNPLEAESPDFVPIAEFASSPRF
jgi:hypothetical protein